MQAQSLSQQIEWHLRANHLLENAKALAFAGAYLAGDKADKWLSKGLEILDAESVEQFLPDGGHFELSPMYHGSMLWNICDLIHLAQISGLHGLESREPQWREVLRRGLDWYGTMTHPDGGIAFFNDAAFRVAPDLADVERYAAYVGVAHQRSITSRKLPTVTALRDSGYLRADLGAGSAAILDVSPIAPKYQPGHAHADTLSFELSVQGHRVFVNSGTSTYDRGVQRDSERATEAHNTVTVDSGNSSDTWAGFRVGRRATPSLLTTSTNGDRITIRAEHDGYRTIVNGATHRRTWTFEGSVISILDEVIGNFRHAVARFHLHPSISVNQDREHSRQLILGLPNGTQLALLVLRGRFTLAGSSWHPEFGKSIPSRCVSVTLEQGRSEVQVLVDYHQ